MIKNEKSDIMQYLPNMQQIDSDMLKEVLEFVSKFNDNDFTDSDVRRALSKEHIDFRDYAALLSTAAASFLEQMAVKAQIETRKHFGNTICLFTPLYTANYCENLCIYCGFNCKNSIHRAQLTLEEVDIELKKIAESGLKEILILTGEAKNKSTVEYIGATLEIARKYFSTIGIEIYPLNVDEYAYLKSKGADFVSVYQETYNTVEYEKQHLAGSKRVFPYRFYAQERAILGGMRGVNFGALLGLSDFRKDAFAAGIHASLMQKKYPQAEVGFSVPRIRPYINCDKESENANIEYVDKNGENNKNAQKNVELSQNSVKNTEKRGVVERQLLQVMLAYRLLMPQAGITISTRENKHFRDNVIGLVATKISAGVSVGVGGHEVEEKGDEQFEISDDRSVDDVIAVIKDKGLQPVFSDTSFL